MGTGKKQQERWEGVDFSHEECAVNKLTSQGWGRCGPSNTTPCNQAWSASCGETRVHSFEQHNKPSHSKFAVFLLFQLALYLSKHFCVGKLLFLSEQAYAAALFPSGMVPVPPSSSLLTKEERDRRGNV